MDIQHNFFVKYLLYPITLFIVVTADTSPKVRKGYPMPHKDCKTGSSPDTEIALKQLGADVGVPCIFPFKVRNKTYHSCTYDYSHMSQYKSWCSTSVDSEGYTLKWGACFDEVKCPIPPRRCGTIKPKFRDDFDPTVSKTIDIRRQPWLVSIGELIFPEIWRHECTGSIITSKHILTSAACVMPIKLDEDLQLRYSIRMGSTNLKSNVIERQITSIQIHPDYKDNPFAFDVGIVEVNEHIEFNDYVQLICIPYLPMDVDEYEDKNLVTIAGYHDVETCNKTETISSLTIIENQVDSFERCKQRSSDDSEFESAVETHITCTKEKLDDYPATLDRGSPVVRHVRLTARPDPYYEQHFIVSAVTKDEEQITILTRITDRVILLWLQEVTDTSPLVMVVGGYSKFKEFREPYRTEKCYKDEKGKCRLKPGLLNDVEIVKSTTKSSFKNAVAMGYKSDNTCTKFVSPVFGKAYILGTDKDGLIVENEGELLGHTGVFTKDAAIICGGKNGDGDQKFCYEWDMNVNRWKSINKHPDDGMPPMKSMRDRAAAVVNDHGNMWVLGGRDEVEEGLTSTEIYKYKRNGKGKWRKGPNLPSDLPAGLSSHCAVRLDNTRTMLIGGFDPVFADQGGEQNEKTWIFNTTHWKSTAPSLVARDRPACCIVNMPDGKVRVLVAGGCDGWCADKKAISSAELYNPETDTWKRVADLPEPLSSTQLELLDNKPTTFGGWNNHVQVGTLYQYHVKDDKWKPHPSTKLRLPRSSAAVFQVPRDFFRC